MWDKLQHGQTLKLHKTFLIAQVPMSDTWIRIYMDQTSLEKVRFAKYVEGFKFTM